MSFRTKIEGLSACLHFENSLQLILSRLFFRKSRFVAHRLGEVQFVADQQGGDECGLRPCLIEGMYEPFLQATGLFKAQSSLWVVDVGANAGGFSLIFATRKTPIKKIAAVEMNPLTYSRMRLNLLTNFGPKAVPLNAAIGGCSMNLSVPFSSGGTGDHIKMVLKASDCAFSVPMLTLDELLDSEFNGQTIDLIKMDIEGAEWDVLKSGKCTRLRDCRFLIIEVHENEGQGIEAFEKAVQPFGLSRVPIRNSGAEDVFLFSNETLNRSGNLKN